jgi:hypothetical protein
MKLSLPSSDLGYHKFFQPLKITALLLIHELDGGIQMVISGGNVSKANNRRGVHSFRISITVSGVFCNLGR